jgi:hypothetical protein
MPFQSHIARRSVMLAALVFALAGAAPSYAVQADVPGSDTRPVNARGTDVAAVDQQNRRSPDAQDAAAPTTPSDVTTALAQERYYSSYGENVEPLTSPGPVAHPGDDGIAPLPFVILLLGALILGAVAGSAPHVLRSRHASRVAT